MALASGTKLGAYEIQSALGAGAMGEVYRARDIRLDRTVASKILASHLSSSPELKQRMEREARATSSLNHPHICQLSGHWIAEQYWLSRDGILEGETLADRLRKGALSLNETLKIGVAVTDSEPLNSKGPPLRKTAAFHRWEVGSELSGHVEGVEDYYSATLFPSASPKG